MAQILVRRKAVADAARRSLNIGVRRRLAVVTAPPAVFIPVRRKPTAGLSGLGAARGGRASRVPRPTEPLGRWAMLLLAAMILVVLGPLIVATCARIGVRGAIRPLPSAEEMLDDWGLPREALELIEGDAVYLQVDDVGDFRVVDGP